MPVTDPTSTTVLDLSRAEQWVLHHVMLEAVAADGGDEAGREPGPALRVLEKLEAGAFAFTLAELECVRGACGRHARTTEAAADRNLASAVSARIEPALEERPTDE